MTTKTIITCDSCQKECEHSLYTSIRLGGTVFQKSGITRLSEWIHLCPDCTTKSGIVTEEIGTHPYIIRTAQIKTPQAFIPFLRFFKKDT